MPHVVRRVKSGRLRWAGNVTTMKSQGTCRIIVEKPSGKLDTWKPRDPKLQYQFVHGCGFLEYRESILHYMAPWLAV